MKQTLIEKLIESPFAYGFTFDYVYHNYRKTTELKNYIITLELSNRLAFLDVCTLTKYCIISFTYDRTTKKLDPNSPLILRDFTLEEAKELTIKLIMERYN